MKKKRFDAENAKDAPRAQRIKTGIPAQAGTHLSAMKSLEEWVPACAGTYELRRPNKTRGAD